MKTISAIPFALLLLLLIPLQANSQLFAPSGSRSFLSSSSTNLDLRAGTSFTTGFGGSSLFTHSIAPSLNWQASERFSVQAGTIFTSTSFSGQSANTMFYGLETTGEQAFLQDNLYGNLSFAVGHFRASENLTLMGGAYYESTNFNQQTQMNPQALNMNARGMLMGFDYKINDNMRIGAEFNFRSGHSPYSYQFNPYSSQGFNRSPFDKRTDW